MEGVGDKGFGCIDIEGVWKICFEREEEVGLGSKMGDEMEV